MDYLVLENKEMLQNRSSQQVRTVMDFNLLNKIKIQRSICQTRQTDGLTSEKGKLSLKMDCELMKTDQ